MRTSTFTFLLSLALWSIVPGALAASPADRCEATKLKTAGKYAYCRMKQNGKAIALGLIPDFVSCDNAFNRKWAHVDGDSCRTVGDGIDVASSISAETDALSKLLSGLRFVDNGDGTVSDVRTGLMWEKKNTQCPGRHCYSDFYTWSTRDDGRPDGTAFTVFLYGLNGGGSSDGTVTSGCFAGHCDWRLPTIEELTGIFDEDQCHDEGCIDPIFGPPMGYYHLYWSATSNDDPSSSSVWFLWFDDLDPDYGEKTDTDVNARAVRAAR